MVATLAAFVATLARPNNPDTLWHLAVGRWIAEHRALPDLNAFYYSPGSGPGYDYSWLSQVLLFGAYRWLGGAGIALLNSAVAALAFYFLYKLLEQNCRNLLINLTVLCLALATMSAYLTGRPVLFTVALLALHLLLLESFLAHRSSFVVKGRGQGVKGTSVRTLGPLVSLSLCPWFMIVAPLTMLLWVNLHPGFMVAPVVMFLFLPLCRSRRDRWTVLAGVFLAGVAVAFNPYGWRMYLLPWETVRALPMLRGLSEWAGVSGWEAVVWGGLVVLGTLGLTRRPQPVMVTLLFGVSALAAGVSCRNLPLFGVVLVFVLGRTLAPALAPVLERAGLLRRFTLSLPGTGGWVWLAAMPVLVVAALRLQVCPINLDFDFSGYPVSAVRHIKSRHCPDHLFVRETWSGYLLWAAPKRKLFYDAKGGFSRQASKAHAELVKPKSGWRRVTRDYGISTCLLEAGSPLAVLLSEAAEWRRAYADSLAEVFVLQPSNSAQSDTLSLIPTRTPEPPNPRTRSAMACQAEAFDAPSCHSDPAQTAKCAKARAGATVGCRSLPARTPEPPNPRTRSAVDPVWERTPVLDSDSNP